MQICIIRIEMLVKQSSQSSSQMGRQQFSCQDSERSLLFISEISILAGVSDNSIGYQAKKYKCNNKWGPKSSAKNTNISVPQNMRKNIKWEERSFKSCKLYCSGILYSHGSSRSIIKAALNWFHLLREMPLCQIFYIV